MLSRLVLYTSTLRLGWEKNERRRRVDKEVDSLERERKLEVQLQISFVGRLDKA